MIGAFARNRFYGRTGLGGPGCDLPAWAAFEPRAARAAAKQPAAKHAAFRTRTAGASDRPQSCFKTPVLTRMRPGRFTQPFFPEFRNGQVRRRTPGPCRPTRVGRRRARAARAGRRDGSAGIRAIRRRRRAGGWARADPCPSVWQAAARGASGPWAKGQRARGRRWRGGGEAGWIRACAALRALIARVGAAGTCACSQQSAERSHRTQGRGRDTRAGCPRSQLTGAGLPAHFGGAGRTAANTRAFRPRTANRAPGKPLEGGRTSIEAGSASPPPAGRSSQRGRTHAAPPAECEKRAPSAPRTRCGRVVAGRARACAAREARSAPAALCVCVAGRSR